MPQEGPPGDTFRVEPGDQSDTLRLIGELDMSSIGELDGALHAHLRGSSALTLDLRDLTLRSLRTQVVYSLPLLPVGPLPP